MSSEKYAHSNPSDGYRSRSHSLKIESKDTNEKGNTLYVSQIDNKCTTADLKKLFQDYGILKDCRIIQNPITGESRGFGFVTFTNGEDADDALRALSGKEMEGRPIRIEKAKRNRPHEPTPGYYKGPPGASIKYDSKGKLRRGYLPYYEVNPRRGKNSPERDRVWRRYSSRSRDRSPRFHGSRVYEDYYAYENRGDRYRDFQKYYYRVRSPSVDGRDSHRYSYRPRSASLDGQHHIERSRRHLSNERYKDEYFEHSPRVSHL